MNESQPKVPTAEELKAMVRAYCDAHLPGWECAGVDIRVGPLAAGKEESLLVLPLSRQVGRDQPE